MIRRVQSPTARAPHRSPHRPTAMQAPSTMSCRYPARDAPSDLRTAISCSRDADRASRRFPTLIIAMISTKSAIANRTARPSVLSMEISSTPE